MNRKVLIHAYAITAAMALLPHSLTNVPTKACRPSGGRIIRSPDDDGKRPECCKMRGWGKTKRLK